MSQPRKKTRHQGPDTPKSYSVNLGWLKATQLRFTKSEVRTLTKPEVLAVETAIKTEMGSAERHSKLSSYSASRKNAEAVVAKSKDLDEALRAFRKLHKNSTMADMDLQKAAAIPKPAMCRALRLHVRTLSKASVEELIGDPVSERATAARDGLGRLLLDIFVKAGGKVTRTKSKSGNESSIAANWLVDIGAAVREDNAQLGHLTFETRDSAENLVVKYAKNRKGS